MTWQMGEQLPESVAMWVAMFWHIYHAPTLNECFSDSLNEELSKIAASERPTLPYVQCSRGTWALVRRVSPRLGGLGNAGRRRRCNACGRAGSGHRAAERP